MYRGLSVAYYPEHWDPSLWENDIKRMLEYGLDAVRVAEFAWGILEPAEGIFNIGYFDEFLDKCSELGMKVIFCTPTAAPPVWAKRNYPGILNRDRAGVAFDGPRRHYSYNSKDYQRLCGAIVEKVASHYGRHPAIVGWQIDNELNCEVAEFFSEDDHLAFGEYLREKFGSLEALNEAFGANFWSHGYSEWSQVRLGGVGLHGSVDPHLGLEEKRFFSQSAIQFARKQIVVLRGHINDNVWITTNGLFPNLDYNKLVDSGLDFITFDSYPNFAHDVSFDPPVGDLLDRKWSWNLAWTRSISPVFGIMEQQAGAHGWVNRMEAPMPKPGQISLWNMQSVAHGADMISYFRWRTSPIGQEIYWHGINDYSNRPNRRCDEVREFSDRWSALEAVSGASYQASVGVLKDYDNDFDAGVDNWHRRVHRFSDDSWFKVTQKTHTPCDFVYVDAARPVELDKYKVLVYPHAAIMTSQISDLLKGYVERGGCLIFGARTGYKDEAGCCPMRPMPGLVGEWVGVEVVDYTLVSRDFSEMSVLWGETSLSAPVFNEVLEPRSPETEILATFDRDHYAGGGAIARRNIGKGVVYYVGSCFSEALVEHLLEETGVKEPYGSVVSVPESMEVAVRVNERGTFLFILNYLNSPGRVIFHRRVEDLITNDEISGGCDLPAFGSLVVKL